MAEKTLQKVQDELTTCSVCLDTYTDPKLLQCFHVYCQGCLRRMVFRDEQGEIVLTCPSCRQVTPVPAGGVAGLQPAFHINRLLGIMEEHKEKQDGPTHAENSSSNCSPQDPATLSCSEHVKEELKLYCETCGKLICFKCVIKGGKHHDHEYELLDEAFEKYKNEVSAALEPMDKQRATINQALEHLHTSHGKISVQQASIEADIHDTIRQLQEALEVRKTQLIGQLHQITLNKLKSLDAQRDHLETIQAQLGSCEDFMKKSMEGGSHCCDVLKIKASVIKQIKELTVPFQPDILKPCTEADLLYSGTAETLANCQSYGQLSGPTLADPSKCYATGNGLEEANVKESSIATLHAMNHQSEPCSQLTSLLECELVSEITGTRVLSKVERTEQNKYMIDYQPNVKGRHCLHIKVDGQHIRGSPFSVAVKSSIQSLGIPLHTITGVKGPRGVALNNKQELVITSYRGQCVHVFSPTLKKLLSFGSFGSGKGQFKQPTGVAVDRDGNILVVDKSNHRVQKFTAEGKFVAAVGNEGVKQLQFDRPEYATFNNKNGKFYVTDTRNHRVQVLNSDLTFSNMFGSCGGNKGQFQHPRGIACDSTGNVYVADWGNARIQIFTAKGNFLKFFTVHGKSVVKGNSLEDVAVDPDGTVYLINLNYLLVLTPEGECMKMIGGEGSEPGKFNFPCGLAVDSNGLVFINDFDNDRIQVF